MQMTQPKTEVGCVRLATITGFSVDVFGKTSVKEQAAKYPQLLMIGIQVDNTDPVSFLAWGPFVVTPDGIVVGTYQIWRAVIPQMLQDSTAAKLAGQINTLFARMGLSCC